MSAGLPAVTQPLTTSAFQHFFQKACVEKTGLSLKIISDIFAYYNSKINKPTYVLHRLDGSGGRANNKHREFACSTWGGQAINYFHSMVGALHYYGKHPFYQHALGLFDPSISPIDPYSWDFSHTKDMGYPPPLSPLLTQLASSDALVYAEDVGFTASGTTLTHHVRTNTQAATSAKTASSFHFPIARASDHDRVRVMAYNPSSSTLMMGTAQGVVASRDFSQTSEWREFPRTPHSTPVHFLAPRGLGFIAVSPLSIREFGKRSILKVIASASDIMQFRTAAYNPYQDTLGVVCRFEGFDTVREYSLETGTYKGEMHFETEVIALSYFYEKWVIVTETSSGNPIVREQNILILGVTAGEIYSNSLVQERTRKLPPEASQVIHKQYLATILQEPEETIIMAPSESTVIVPFTPMISYRIAEKDSPIWSDTIRTLLTINS